jgi:hypothetical protein
MRVLFLGFLLINSVFLFAQTKYSKNQEVLVFDGVDWIDSKIIDLDGKGKYLVYINRQKSKTKWVGIDDLDIIYTDITENVIQITVNVEESQDVPVLKVGDKVKYLTVTKWVSTEIVELKPEECLVYEDFTKTTTRWMPEKLIELIEIEPGREFRTRVTKKQFIYLIDEEVYYKDNEYDSYLIGKIEKMNDSNQIFINGKWYETHQVSKLDQ